MLTGTARMQLRLRPLKKTVGPSKRTLSVMQWKKPRYLRCPIQSIWRRALIRSIGVPTHQPQIPERPPARSTTLHSAGKEKHLFYIIQMTYIQCKEMTTVLPVCNQYLCMLVCGCLSPLLYYTVKLYLNLPGSVRSGGVSCSQMIW